MIMITNCTTIDIKDESIFLSGFLDNYGINEVNNTICYKFIIVDKENKRIFSNQPTKSEVSILSRLNNIYPSEKISIGQ